MRIAIVAATGGVGRLLVQQALDAGHDVTAVARAPQGFPADVSTMRMDLSDPDIDTLTTLFTGKDAVLSCLGAPSRAEAGIVEVGTSALLTAATRAGTPHLSMISAAPVGTTPSPGRPDPPKTDPGDDFVTSRIMTPIVRSLYRDVYADLATAEDLLRDSAIEWTVVRPPRLTNGPARTYRFSIDGNVRGGRSVSRAAVAACMLRSASDAALANEVVRIAR